MTIDLSGQGSPVIGGLVAIRIEKDHPLIKLAKALPWDTLINIVAQDIQNTTSKGCWYTGRRIKVRMHLGAYLLQRIYNLTDRKLEYQIKDNAAFQLFCGRSIVDGWQPPDHTKIETFRNRLSPETQRMLANTIAGHAVKLGFADPRSVDFDSTVQEANIAYPSDASLMSKLAGMGKKFVDFLRNKGQDWQSEIPHIDLSAVRTKAREYFFLAKNSSIETKRLLFKQLHCLVKQQMRPIVAFSRKLSNKQIGKLPWNIRLIFDRITSDAWRYLLDVGHFTRKHTIKAGKILSFHAKDLRCIKKGKAGKECEFGRVFQIGRIKGNFLFVLRSSTVDMNDKMSFIPMIEEHQSLFGAKKLKSVATDKGYWCERNRQKLEELKLTDAGLQRPAIMKKKPGGDLALQEGLRNRRAGIEPLIGHMKHGGMLGKSRMKSDSATLAAGYGSVLGMNLRQLVRHQQGKMRDAG